MGSHFFLSLNLPAVPVFVVALQMAARRLSGRSLTITQFLTMTKYRCMDLVTAIVSTPEVDRFIEALEKDGGQFERSRELLFEAVRSQEEACRHARSSWALPAVYMLYVETCSGLRKLAVFFLAAAAITLLRILGLVRSVPMEVVISHPEIYPEAPVVGRPGIRLPYLKCFGLHYQIWEDRMVITFMPSVSWKPSNSELTAAITQSLELIRSIFCSE